MFYRYACPVCGDDLRNSTPATKRFPWYKFITRHTLLCPHCGAEIEKRFADFDTGLSAGFATLLAGGGFVSIWGVGKFVIPLVSILIGLRVLAGSIFSVYVQVIR
jgi:rRNA maturation protein Nop10